LTKKLQKQKEEQRWKWNVRDWPPPPKGLLLLLPKAPEESPKLPKPEDPKPAQNQDKEKIILSWNAVERRVRAPKASE